MNEIYYASMPLHLETNASDVDLGTRLLQVRDGMNCGCDEVPDTTTVHSTTFASKSLSSTEKCYRIIE